MRTSPVQTATAGRAASSASIGVATAAAAIAAAAAVGDVRERAKAVAGAEKSGEVVDELLSENERLRLIIQDMSEEVRASTRMVHLVWCVSRLWSILFCVVVFVLPFACSGCVFCSGKGKRESVLLFFCFLFSLSFAVWCSGSTVDVVTVIFLFSSFGSRGSVHAG